MEAVRFELQTMANQQDQPKEHAGGPKETWVDEEVHRVLENLLHVHQTLDRKRWTSAPLALLVVIVAGLQLLGLRFEASQDRVEVCSHE